MFADISGFTAMSEKMSPEEVTSIMNDWTDGDFLAKAQRAQNLTAVHLKNREV